MTCNQKSRGVSLRYFQNGLEGYQVKEDKRMYHLENQKVQCRNYQGDFNLGMICKDFFGRIKADPFRGYRLGDLKFMNQAQKGCLNRRQGGPFPMPEPGVDPP